MRRRLTLIVSCLLASSASAETIVRITEIELRRRLDIVAAAPFSKVEYTGPRGLPVGPSRSPVVGALNSEIWTGSGGSSYGREQVDLSIRETTIGIKDWTASADLSTWFWTARPSTARFRPGDDVELYLFEAQVSNRSSRNPIAVSAGRLRPWNIPGVGLLDGGQVGWRLADQRMEVGAYGGVYPDMTSLSPETQTWAGGVYYEQSYVETRDLYLHQELRLGLHHTSEFGSRFEGETLLSANVKRILDLSLDLLAGLGNGTVSDPSLDALRFDLGLHPMDKLKIYGGVRLLERQAAEIDQPVLEGSRHGDLSALYQFLPNLSVSVTGGVAAEVGGSGADRSYVGPEVRYRNVSVGYQEDWGWMSGSLIYVQPTFNFGDRHRLVVRASVSEERNGDLAQHEWALFSALQSRILDFLSLRLSVQALGGDTPLGFIGGLDLTGRI